MASGPEPFMRIRQVAPMPVHPLEYYTPDPVSPGFPLQRCQCNRLFRHRVRFDLDGRSYMLAADPARCAECQPKSPHTDVHKSE